MGVVRKVLQDLQTVRDSVAETTRDREGLLADACRHKAAAVSKGIEHCELDLYELGACEPYSRFLSFRRVRNSVILPASPQGTEIPFASLVLLLALYTLAYSLLLFSTLKEAGDLTVKSTLLVVFHLSGCALGMTSYLRRVNYFTVTMINSLAGVVASLLLLIGCITETEMYSYAGVVCYGLACPVSMFRYRGPGNMTLKGLMKVVGIVTTGCLVTGFLVTALLYVEIVQYTPLFVSGGMLSAYTGLGVYIFLRYRKCTTRPNELACGELRSLEMASCILSMTIPKFSIEGYILSCIYSIAQGKLTTTFVGLILAGEIGIPFALVLVLKRYMKSCHRFQLWIGALLAGSFGCFLSIGFSRVSKMQHVISGSLVGLSYALCECTLPGKYSMKLNKTRYIYFLTSIAPKCVGSVLVLLSVLAFGDNFCDFLFSVCSLLNFLGLIVLTMAYFEIL